MKFRIYTIINKLYIIFLLYFSGGKPDDITVLLATVAL